MVDKAAANDGVTGPPAGTRSLRSKNEEKQVPDKDQPYLESQSIYSFDLDKRTLTFSDYDLFAPGRNLTLHMGFTVKKISTKVRATQRCELRRALAAAPSLESAYKNSTKASPKEARIEIIDGSVNFKIIDKLTVKADEALLLVLEYTIDLEGPGKKLLFTGAIQPSDYRNIHNSLRVKDIHKEIVLQVTSKSEFSVRVFNGSQPRAFPDLIPGTRQKEPSTLFSTRTALALDLQDWERAIYFSISET